jgi:hypothetical protein
MALTAVAGLLIGLFGAPAPAQTLPEAAVLAALCPAGEKCGGVTQRALGTDAAGRTMVLAGLDVTSKPFEATFNGPCYPQPHAVLRVSEGRIVQTEPVVTLHAESECSYGASGGDEGLEFRDGRLIFSVTGGSAWGWSESRTWTLSPALTLVESTNGAWWKLGPNTTETTRDARTGVTRTRWGVPACEGYSTDDPMKSPLIERAYTVIPRVAAGEVEALRAGWRTAALPARALDVTSAGGDGYVVHGKPGEAADARLRVVALGDRELIVEVADDHVVSGGKTWIFDDHLELWAGDSSLSFEATCHALNPKAPLPDNGVRPGRAWQWGVRLTDAVISRGGGKPKVDPQIERATTPTATRFRVVFAAEAKVFAVVYSDSDDAKTQKRLIGTAMVGLKDPFSLGLIEGAASP